MKTRELSLETRMIHAGEPRPRTEGAITQPIFQSSTFESRDTTDYFDSRYIRLSNTPNHLTLAEKLAELEEVEDGVVTASGMAAISTALLGLVGQDEHLLVQEDLYGGTFHFLKEDFPHLGRRVSFFSLAKLNELEDLITPATRAIYVESISNPLLKLPDFHGVIRFARERGLVTIIDNTFPSPVNFQPARLGFDIVLHSATKYLNGHSDIVAGCILGPRAALSSIKRLLAHLGGSLDPNSCFLLNRGLKTLAVRVKAQNERALALARALEANPNVRKVHYPGLESHPHHQRAREFLRGYGGMLSFEYNGDGTAAAGLLHRLELAASAPSLGGVETLVTRPAVTSHSGVAASDRQRLGIGDSLVRVSVGLEHPDDLVADFTRALGG